MRPGVTRVSSPKCNASWQAWKPESRIFSEGPRSEQTLRRGARWSIGSSATLKENASGRSVEGQPFRVVTERARECFEMSTCDRVEVLDVDNQVVFRFFLQSRVGCSRTDAQSPS